MTCIDARQCKSAIDIQKHEPISLEQAANTEDCTQRMPAEDSSGPRYRSVMSPDIRPEKRTEMSKCLLPDQYADSKDVGMFIAIQPRKAEQNAPADAGKLRR